MPFIIPAPANPEPPVGIASAAATIPHFTFPFTFNPATGVGVAEQDSLEEISSCCAVIASCPAGGWPDVPAFGIPSPLFSQAPVDAGAITRAIFRWEPRAVVTATEYPDVLNDAIRHVQITVSPAQGD